MATWSVIPVLLARRISTDEEFSRTVQAAYSSFGISWRLVDDLQDIEKDMMKGVHSSIYVCLNEDVRGYWDKDTEEKKDPNKGYVQAILSYILEKGVIDTIMDRACSELESAACIADSCNMPGLAREFRSLLKPLRDGLNRL